MGRKKRYRGQFCKVCGEVKANEKFTGKGHRNHICKKCSKKSVAQREEEKTLRRIYEFAMYPKISKKSRKVLKKYQDDERECVRVASEEVLEMFTQSGRNNNFREENLFDFDEDNEEFYDEFDEDDFLYYHLEDDTEAFKADYDPEELPF